MLQPPPPPATRPPPPARLQLQPPPRRAPPRMTPRAHAAAACPQHAAVARASAPQQRVRVQLQQLAHRLARVHVAAVARERREGAERAVSFFFFSRRCRNSGGGLANGLDMLWRRARAAAASAGRARGEAAPQRRGGTAELLMTWRSSRISPRAYVTSPAARRCGCCGAATGRGCHASPREARSTAR